jgi:hypothetical protein
LFHVCILISFYFIQVWLQERENERVPILKKPIPEMYRALTARPKWEPRLILPKVAYPNKYAAFSVSRFSKQNLIFILFYIHSVFEIQHVLCKVPIGNE